MIETLYEVEWAHWAPHNEMKRNTHRHLDDAVEQAKELKNAYNLRILRINKLVLIKKN